MRLGNKGKCNKLRGFFYMKLFKKEKDVRYKRFKEYRNSQIITKVVLLHVAFFLIPFLIHMFSSNVIVRFYCFMIGGTVLCVSMFEVIILEIYTFVKDRKYKDKISKNLFALFLMLLVGTFLTGFSNYIVKYYKDVPILLKNNYASVSGVCSFAYPYYGKGSHLDITIDNIKFDVGLGYKNSIKRGGIYKVVFLPNTKEVIDIYGK